MAWEVKLLTDMFLLLSGLIAGLVVGFLICKVKFHHSSGLFGHISTVNVQIAEMKARFEEIEKARQKIEEQREKRFSEFIANVHSLFKEMKERTVKIDEEKNRRIDELAKHIKVFFEEQKKHTEQFLLEQGKSREEIERRRDAQIEDMKRMIAMFTKTVSGTKTRGMTGEVLLKEALKESIRVGLIKCNLKTDNGEVEFAWDLGDGKYIPVDSKLPDIFEVVEKYCETFDAREREEYRRVIVDKIKKEIGRVQKYQNLPNTIDACILVVPESVLEIAPDLVSFGKYKNVFVCSYKDVFPIAHVLQGQYIRLKREGDIGKYRQMIQVLLRILDNISAKLDTIDRAMSTVKNASDKIRSEVLKGRRAQEDLKSHGYRADS